MNIFLAIFFNNGPNDLKPPKYRIHILLIFPSSSRIYQFHLYSFLYPGVAVIHINLMMRIIQVCENENRKDYADNIDNSREISLWVNKCSQHHSHTKQHQSKP